ncbi:hypothetical protein GQ457_14G013170 [Hibiscus cannabinus]
MSPATLPSSPSPENTISLTLPSSASSGHPQCRRRVIHRPHHLAPQRCVSRTQPLLYRPRPPFEISDAGPLRPFLCSSLRRCRGLWWELGRRTEPGGWVIGVDPGLVSGSDRYSTDSENGSRWVNCSNVSLRAGLRRNSVEPGTVVD